MKRLFRKKDVNKVESGEGTAVLPTPLSPGTPAPDFTLDSNTGQKISLSDFRGQPVILAFYPADNSPVCSSQLALYNEVLPLFKEHNAALLAVSTDSPTSHQTFAQNLSLSFPLLADNDPAGAVAQAFGVYDETNQICERALFVIDDTGKIHWSSVSPKGVNPGANGILDALESLD
jgi:peroxiredoxin